MDRQFIETQIKALEDKRTRLRAELQQVQEELNDLTQLLYDDMRVYRTGERQLDTRIDGHRGRRGAALKYHNLLLFTV